MSGTVISQGAIDSFGSIFVNGVEWQTTSAQVEIDGVMRPAPDLRVGMVVRVQGDFDAGGATGSAFEVVYDAIPASFDVREFPHGGAVLLQSGGMSRSRTSSV
jgi:hypothetical protein